MAKKTSYTGKDVAALEKELKELRAANAENMRGAMRGRNIKEYRANKKNIARILTVLNTKA
jgi:ribosomal protein L29